MPASPARMAVTPYRAGHDPTVKTAFANILRERMAALNLSQADLARRSGLHRDNISGYVNAQVFPRPEKLHRLARALECSVAELIPKAALNAPLAEEPALDIRMTDKPGEVFLRIAAKVPLDLALRIAEMVSKGSSADVQNSAA